MIASGKYGRIGIHSMQTILTVHFWTGNMREIFGQIPVRQFFKYAAVGLIGTVVHYSVLWGLVEYRHLDFAFLAPGDEMEFGDAYAQALSMTRYLRNRIGE